MYTGKNRLRSPSPGKFNKAQKLRKTAPEVNNFTQNSSIFAKNTPFWPILAPF